jgi:hypothetical protein
MDRSAGRSGAAEGVEHVIVVRREAALPGNVLPVLPLLNGEAEKPIHRPLGNKNVSAKVGVAAFPVANVAVFNWRDNEGLSVGERQLTGVL